MLSNRFTYLADAARRYGADEVFAPWSCDSIVADLGAEDLENLANAYQQVLAREDAIDLYRLLSEEKQNGRPGAEWWAVQSLLKLFRELGLRGVEPFHSQPLPDMRAADPPSDWSKLPVEFHYLTVPADRYGGIQGEFDVEQFAERISPALREEFARLGARAREDSEQLRYWFDDYDMVEHPEAAKLYFFLTLLTKLGMM